ncbi:DegT/DnrJ/EryC1/StrS family aminotransferase [Streptomyces sp. NPDC008125]|uniref:DegT/DnrJ/EryC1/StrS family aminotransferase n=1 Tax=Streptomyces sp. NPDC008125 TaxID=3364811 RepID=UPI0036F137E2
MEPFDTATVLARVMTTGVVMSIEKSDRELPGLERLLTKQSGRTHAVLVNSRSGALHAALAGQGIGHGDEVARPGLDAKDRSFLGYLGITVADAAAGGAPAYETVALDPGNASRIRDLTRAATAPALVVDLTGLGFGPAAAVLTDDERIWARAERLKIFGAYDLRTMWTQQEDATELVPGVQFNYRLSPLVAACVRMALSQATRPAPVTGAAQ